MKKYRERHPNYKETDLCSVEGCGKRATHRGMCKSHYAHENYINLGFDDTCRDPNRGCKVPLCKNKHHAKGYCNFHLMKLRSWVKAGNNPDEFDGRKTIISTCCQAGDCMNDVVRKGFCRSHYRRYRGGTRGAKLNAPINYRFTKVYRRLKEKGIFVKVYGEDTFYFSMMEMPFMIKIMDGHDYTKIRPVTRELFIDVYETDMDKRRRFDMGFSIDDSYYSA